jgi:hypothetical protein
MHPFSYIKDFEETFWKAMITILKREDYVVFQNWRLCWLWVSLTKTCDYYVKIIMDMRQRQLMNEDLCMIIVQFKEASRPA